MLDENVKKFHIYIYIPYSTMSEKMIFVCTSFEHR